MNITRIPNIFLPPLGQRLYLLYTCKHKNLGDCALTKAFGLSCNVNIKISDWQKIQAFELCRKLPSSSAEELAQETQCDAHQWAVGNRKLLQGHL